MRKFWIALGILAVVAGVGLFIACMSYPPVLMFISAFLPFLAGSTLQQSIIMGLIGLATALGIEFSLLGFARGAVDLVFSIGTGIKYCWDGIKSLFKPQSQEDEYNPESSIEEQATGVWAYLQQHSGKIALFTIIALTALTITFLAPYIIPVIGAIPLLGGAFLALTPVLQLTIIGAGAFLAQCAIFELGKAAVNMVASCFEKETIKEEPLSPYDPYPKQPKTWESPSHSKQIQGNSIFPPSAQEKDQGYPQGYSLD